jgi:hypothetical protein
MKKKTVSLTYLIQIVKPNTLQLFLLFDNITLYNAN